MNIAAIAFLISALPIARGGAPGLIEALRQA
jgi:hypothetical protein